MSTAFLLSQAYLFFSLSTASGMNTSGKGMVKAKLDILLYGNSFRWAEAPHGSAR
jgi:hypothetical protein